MKRIFHRVPGRAGVIGNPSDIYGGCVVSTSVPRAAEAAIFEAPSFSVLIRDNSVFEFDACTDFVAAMHQSSIALPASVMQFLLHVIREDAEQPAARLFGVIGSEEVRARLLSQPFRMEESTTIPYRAGLAGSTAVGSAFLRCVFDWIGVSFESLQLAEIVKFVEQNVLRNECGYQDHYMTSFGGFRFLSFEGKQRHLQSEDEPFAQVEDLGSQAPLPPLVVAHLGSCREQFPEVHKSIRQRWREGDPLVRGNNAKIAELGRQGREAVLAQDYRSLGELMNENHALQRELGGTTDLVEDILTWALDHGALGAKLAGGGRGGTVILLHEDPAWLAKEIAHQALVVFHPKVLYPEREES